MGWKEFTMLLTNLPAESQLARAVAVRTAEGDALGALSAAQRKLRNDWYDWINSQTSEEEKAEDGEQLQNYFKSMFYEGRD